MNKRQLRNEVRRLQALWPEERLDKLRGGLDLLCTMGVGLATPAALDHAQYTRIKDEAQALIDEFGRLVLGFEEDAEGTE